MPLVLIDPDKQHPVTCTQQYTYHIVSSRLWPPITPSKVVQLKVKPIDGAPRMVVETTVQGRGEIQMSGAVSARHWSMSQW